MDFKHPNYLHQIERAKRLKSKKLDLSDYYLTIVPEEIFELDFLEELILRNNALKVLPERLKELSNLKLIDIRNNPIQELNGLNSLFINDFQKDFLKDKLDLSQIVGLDLSNNDKDKYSFLKEFAQLQILDLSENYINDYSFLKELAQLRILDLSENYINDYSFLKDLTQMESLFLRRNEINDGSFLEGFTQLEGLDLSENQIDDDSFLEGLCQLKRLNLKGNLIDEVIFLERLTQLQSLDLSENPILDYSFLKGLTKLEYLDLHNNQMDSHYSSLLELMELHTVYLKGNEIKDLSCLEQLTKLEVLNLRGNQIRDGNPLKGLIQLQSLDLRGNQINDYSFLKELSQLQSLDLSENQIKDGSFLKELPQLQILNLRGNQINDYSFLKELSQLQSLDLSENQIKDGSFLKELSQLQSLDLSENQIKDGSFLKELSQLQSLDLSENQIKDGSFLKELSQLQSLDLGFNLLKEPPLEIVNRGLNVIRNYFSEKEAEGEVSLYEAKLLILGEGGVGKTSLANKIINPQYQLKKDEKPTEGIDVYQWVFPFKSQENNGEEIDFRVNIWDFGGQEIYHATHQFFLTKRSLYALVADTRKEEANFNYWMHIVELLTANSPLIIVQNEKQNRSKQINLPVIKARFSNLTEAAKVNLEDNRGLDKLLNEFRHQLGKLPLVGNKLPKTWPKIRKVLEEDGRNYISFDEYLKICKENGIANNQRALNLSNYYHDLGVFLHFQEDAILKKIIILKPEWGTDAVYKVLDNKQVKEASGRFTKGTLRVIWSDKKYELAQDELLRLMEKFQLCYQVENKDIYISPELLPVEQPKYDWNPSQNLIMRFTYDFMPKGIITRLIVRMHHIIKDQNLVWKVGFILGRNNTEAEIIETYGKNEIKIRVEGADKKSLMTLIMDAFEKIHATYSELKYQKLIPCNCVDCKGFQEPNFYEYEDLIRRRYKNKDTVECKKSFMNVEVLPLIDDIIDPRLIKKKGDDFESLAVRRMTKENLDEKIIINNYLDVSSSSMVKNNPQITVNVAVKNESILNLSGTLEAIKDEMLDELENEKEKKKLANEIERVEGAIQEVKAIDTPEKAKEKIGTLKKIGNFLNKLDDTSTKAGKAFKAVENGYGHLQDLAKYYNNIAEWCALPQVPKVFLKREKNG